MIRKFSWLCSFLTLGFIVFLGSALVMDGMSGLSSVGFFSPGYWDFRQKSFHALSMFFGTATVAVLAMTLAVPLGLGAAIFVSEHTKGKTRAFIKVLLELLAGIPSVVYGLLGVGFVIPLMGEWIIEQGGVSGESLLTAGGLLGIMVLPTMMTFADDALRCVPKKMREEALSLGLSKWQVTSYVVLPQAKAGILGAAMLALGRAMGETIAIFLVIGRVDYPFSSSIFSFETLLGGGQTLTTKIGGAELSIAYGDPQHWSALMALAVTLWVSVTALAFGSGRILRSKN
ncbi:MAG: phosphate ABC transporter permease subunit PstC [Oligoflexales bacterium]